MKALKSLAGLMILTLFGSCTVLPEALSKPGIALVYTVEDYVAGADVAGANMDQTNMTARFAKDGWTVQSRANGDATTSNLAIDYAWALGQLEPYQRFVFYFSGHGAEPGVFAGVTDEALVLHDAITAGPSYHSSGFVTPARMQTMLAPLLAKKIQVVLILDSCFSGGFVGEYIYDDDLSLNEGLGSNQIANPQGWGFFQAVGTYFGTGSKTDDGLGGENLWVVSAAGPREESFGSSQGGIFTNYFLQAAKGPGDANGDKVLTVMELYRTARRGIADYFNVKDTILDGEDYTFLPHISGNYTDLLLFSSY